MAAQREWFDKDYYAVLGVDKGADDREITKAYRRLARQNHPDANPGDSAAEDRFKEVSTAYDVIGNAERREEYDEIRRLGPMGGGPAGGGPGGPFAGFDPQDFADLGGLFGNLFNRGGAPGRGPSRPARGADVEAELHLSFLEAVHGVTTSVNLTSDAPCRACSGSGARRGTRPSTCARCGGRGVREDNQGLFSFSQPCAGCSGQGQIIDKPCENCRGSGTERRSREIKVRIPPGVDDGQRIRLKGKGEPGSSGGPRGDLFVRVDVEADGRFGRRGTDLTLVVPITYPEAVLGADLRVPTLDGGSVTLRIPAGTRSGRKFRVRGQGVTTTKKTGDLLVTVEIDVPDAISDEERAAIEALSDVSEHVPRAHL